VRAATLVLRDAGRTSEYSPQDLAHEAWLRLRRNAPPDDASDGMRGAERVMRRILIDENRARRRAALEAGAEDELEYAADPSPRFDDLSDMLDALRTLGHRDPLAARATALHHLLGRTTAETAQALGVSLSTVERQLRRAKEFLREQLLPP
jgi:RNA polymerase sigma factor (sigma-70 family)